MNRTRHTLLACFLLSAVASLAIGIPPDVPLAKNLPEPKSNRGGVMYSGVVIEVTKTTITLKLGDEPAKCFQVSGTLAAGEIPMQPRPIPGSTQPYRVWHSCMYRLTDVKVGDEVGILYSKIDDVVICDHIGFGKRPGGLVPPLPKEVEDLRDRRERWKAQNPGLPLPEDLVRYEHIPHHEFMNAYWDLMDRGIPFPEKFGPNRWWLTAPMPREVVPKPVPKL